MRSSRRAQAKNNGVRDMLNVGTGNLHDGSSWVVSHYSTALKWRGVFRRCHSDLIGLGRRQVVTYRTKMVVTYRTKKVVIYRTKKVVTYRTKKERRGTENRTKAWVYIYMPKIQILQNTHACTLYIHKP